VPGRAGTGRRGQVGGSTPLAGDRVRPEGGRLQRGGTEREHLVDADAATTLGAPGAQPGAPRSPGGRGVIGEQLGAHERRVRLPQLQPTSPGPSPLAAGQLVMVVGGRPNDRLWLRTTGYQVYGYGGQVQRADRR